MRFLRPSKPLLGIIVALGVAILGTILLTRSHAATPFITVEAEQGTLTAPATALSDTTASGGNAVKFTAAIGGSSCALPKYPSAACTGVPAGTTFTNNISGDYVVTTAGQTIDKWHITGDLIIHANNVVVTNSQIDRTVDNEAAAGQFFSFTITDSTVGPPSACTNTSPASCQSGNNSAGCIVAPGVGEASYTATRVYVRGHDDGFRMSGDNVTVQDSYEYACYLNASFSPPDGSHSDGFQAYCPGAICTNLHMLHNTLDLSGVPATFTFNMTEPNLRTLTANDNLLLGGGNYIIDAWWRAGANWIFHNNRIVQGTWGNDTRLIAAVTTEGSCSHQDWQGNTVVTIDSNYNVTSTVQSVPCLD